MEARDAKALGLRLRRTVRAPPLLLLCAVGIVRDAITPTRTASSKQRSNGRHSVPPCMQAAASGRLISWRATQQRRPEAAGSRPSIARLFQRAVIAALCAPPLGRKKTATRQRTSGHFLSNSFPSKSASLTSKCRRQPPRCARRRRRRRRRRASLDARCARHRRRHHRPCSASAAAPAGCCGASRMARSRAATR